MDMRHARIYSLFVLHQFISHKMHGKISQYSCKTYFKMMFSPIYRVTRIKLKIYTMNYITCNKIVTTKYPTSKIAFLNNTLKWFTPLKI